MPVLGYWNIRALAQAIRFMLHYCEEEFEDKRYVATKNDDGTINRDDWLKEKFELGLDFPNLPYYIDGSVKLTQSYAILQYLGRKYNMCGKTTEEKARIDMATEEIHDQRIKYFKISFSLNFAEDKPEFVKITKAKFAQFEKFLGDRKWIAGDDMTYVDFPLYETLSAHLAMEPTILDDCLKLREYRSRFEAEPKIKRYMESNNYIRSPFNIPFAPGFSGIVE